MSGLVLAASSGGSSSSGGSFLITPNVGLMVWTLLLFVISMYILAKLAFPRITEALDRRQKAIEDSIDHAERIRREADQLLEEYGQHESGLATLARVGFDTLGLQTFLTAGPKESRAWTIRKGATAPDAINHLLSRGLEVVDPPKRLPPERRSLPSRSVKPGCSASAGDQETPAASATSLPQRGPCSSSPGRRTRRGSTRSPGRPGTGAAASR